MFIRRAYRRIGAFQLGAACGIFFPRKIRGLDFTALGNFDLRKNPLTPWLKPYMIDRIKNFETVLNGYYPTVSDVKLSSAKRKIISMLHRFATKRGCMISHMKLKRYKSFG